MQSPLQPLGRLRQSHRAPRLAFALSALLGCQEPDAIELVALRGCGLEQEFSGLRVRLIGDFPASEGAELLLGPGERGQIPAIADTDATSVAAEGLFGNTVTAIGRSFGLDAGLGRGRVPGRASDEPIIPVYFAAPDSQCRLDIGASTLLLDARAGFGAGAGPGGDALLAGGIAIGAGTEDSLLAELVHVDLFATTVEVLEVELPSARRGASVHPLGGRRFAVLGGAGAGVVLDEWIEVDVGTGHATIGDPRELDGQPIRVAHHASALGPDGRVLIAGGCDEVDATGACMSSAVISSAAWLDPADPSATDLGDLERARAHAHAIVASDGVVFVAGGFGSDGAALASLERLAPDPSSDPGWAIVHTLPEPRTVAGLALLDGGLVLIADHDGAIHWWSTAASGTLDPTSRAPMLEPLVGDRPMLALPGERVLVEGWLFAPATAAVDPALERVGLDAGLGSLAGAIPLLLGDGTVLQIDGGSPSFARVRPELDGAHEWIPDLAGPQTDAFVANVPGRATVIVGGLQVDGLGSPDELAPVHAHVRGFRSGALRLEFEYEADPGTVAQLVLGYGANAAVAVALLPDTVVVRVRSPSGSVESLDCGLAGLAPSTSVVVELEDHARAMRVSSDGTLVAECALAWPESLEATGVSVGFGASGPGSARFFRLRLART